MNSDNKITIKYNNTMYIFIIWLSHFRTVYQLSTLLLALDTIPPGVQVLRMDEQSCTDIAVAQV